MASRNMTAWENEHQARKHKKNKTIRIHKSDLYGMNFSSGFVPHSKPIKLQTRPHTRSHSLSSVGSKDGGSTPSGKTMSNDYACFSKEFIPFTKQ